MADVRQLLALFQDSTDQVPHSAVAKALLTDPRRAYLRSTREWLDAQMDELARLAWVTPATGPRGGKAWRLTDAGQRAMADWHQAEARRKARAAKREADRITAETHRIERLWAALATTPGLSIAGETVTVTAQLSDPTEMVRLGRALEQAAELIQRRADLRQQLARTVK